MTDTGDALAPGMRLDEFEIEGVLGAGGFGVTYRARDLRLNRWVAIKEYLPLQFGTRRRDGTVGPKSGTDGGDYGWGLSRFREEGQKLAQCDHPHVVRVYRDLEAWGTAYLVMEYVEGPAGRARSLEDELVASVTLPESRVRAILDALTSGLVVVHAAGLVHRDIKPSNVMLRPDGSPVLIDFGSARPVVTRQTESYLIVTDGYAAWEQYVGDRSGQGPWTDIYALGAVAYEALSGEVPVKAPERVEEDPVRPLSEVSVRPVSAGLAAAIDASLRVFRKDRPQSLEEWRGHLEGSAVSVRGAVGDRGAGRQRETEAPEWWRGWRLGAASAGLAVLVVLVGLLAFRNGGVRGPEGAVVEVALEVDAAISGGPGSGDSASDRGAVSRPEPAATAEREAPSGEEVEAGLGLVRGSWRRIQLGLASLGFDPGVVDGSPDPATREALRAWQASVGEGATGYLDAGSASVLEAAGGDARAGTVFRECVECPELVVQLGGSLALGRYEVTVGEYRAFASATGGGAGGGCITVGDRESWRDPGFPQTDRHPVTCVNWDDAQAYVSWLSRRTGSAYRLPTEAEWERAASGSQPGCGRLGRGSRPDGTCPAGQSGTNAAGLSDMVGNVWEWTSDCWEGDCGRRVVRGGSWSNIAGYLRPGARTWNSAGNRAVSQGFRVSRTLD